MRSNVNLELAVKIYTLAQSHPHAQYISNLSLMYYSISLTLRMLISLLKFLNMIVISTHSMPQHVKDICSVVDLASHLLSFRECPLSYTRAPGLQS